MSKKTFAPGTFLPFPQRFLAILQLCLSFSLVLWYLSQPFMGEYFNVRSRMLLYEYAMGTSNSFNALQAEKLERNAQRWANLPSSTQKGLLKDYRSLQDYAKRSFGTKFKESVQLLFFDLPPFELAWLLFSIVIAILLLLKIDGAKQVVWLLPFIALAYGIDNYRHGHTSQSSSDEALFPTEFFITERYLQGELSSNLEEQRQQLRRGWEAYLAEFWSGGSSVEEAEFNFTIARLKHLSGMDIREWKSFLTKKLSPFMLLSYILWNLLFARLLSRSTSSQNKQQITSNSYNIA